MAVFARRQNGAPTKAVTIRIDPAVAERVELFAKRIPMTANLAYEEILVHGLSTIDKTDKAVGNVTQMQ
ncbi:MAG: hypothetical protein LBC56_05585 [Oscillospiraceae bacterium]|jgi:predicted transcriptional regulator|nr:hypothetical protein [Oscillospiraceae bacterium]